MAAGAVHEIGCRRAEIPHTRAMSAYIESPDIKRRLTPLQVRACHHLVMDASDVGGQLAGVTMGVRLIVV